MTMRRSINRFVGAVAAVGAAGFFAAFAQAAPPADPDLYDCLPISAENLIEQPPPMWLQTGQPPPDPDMAKLQTPSEPLCPGGEIAYPKPLHGPQGPPPSEPWITLPALGKPPQGSGNSSGYYKAGYQWSGTNYGGGVSMAIAQPTVNQTRMQVHSLAQLAFYNNVANGVPGVQNGVPKNTIEFGWNVDPRLYADDGRVRLFTYVNRNYYRDNGTTDCYNCNFTPTQTTYTPSQVLSPTATPVRFAVYHYNGNWWYWFNDRWLGYTPGSYYNHSFTSAVGRQYFGEVYDLGGGGAPDSDMGNGFHGTDSRATKMTFAYSCPFAGTVQIPTYPCNYNRDPISNSVSITNAPSWYNTGYIANDGNGGEAWRFGGPGAG